MAYKIKEYRKALRMSQAELSKMSGVSRSIICGLESGSYKVTTTATLEKIAGALGKNVNDILVPESSTK